MPEINPTYQQSAAELQRQIALEREGEPFVVHRDGDGAQRLTSLAGRERVTIGREEAVDVDLAGDEQVSRVHAELELIGGSWVIVDDGLSTNGTFVNDEPVKRARQLRVRDTVRVGECQLVYALAEQVCPRCHQPDTLTSLDDVVAERQDGANGLAIPTHACPQCGHEYWIVASRREGWQRSWLWRWQTLRHMLATRGKDQVRES